LDGLVDAQPLYVAKVLIPSHGIHNVLIAATENDSLYALDAETGAELWKTSLLASGETPSDPVNCSQVIPQIGITSTPVINLGILEGRGLITVTLEGAVFAVAMSKDSTGNYHQRLYKVELTTGKQIANVEITAKYPGTGSGSSGGYVVFNPEKYVERAGLLLLNGVVYLGWSSHCDHQPYTGWIMGYNAETLAQTAVINVTPNGSEGSIWMAGGGLAADSSGYIYFRLG
jgi:outer membrane protein assembly factor BamB